MTDDLESIGTIAGLRRPTSSAPRTDPPTLIANTFRSNQSKLMLTRKEKTSKTTSKGKLCSLNSRRSMALSKKTLRRYGHNVASFMEDIEIPDTIREQFHVFLRNTKECREWQQSSSSHNFPYVELNLGRDCCWLRNIEESISAMDTFAQTGECMSSFYEVPILDAYADADDIIQKLSRTYSENIDSGDLGVKFVVVVFQSLFTLTTSNL